MFESLRTPSRTTDALHNALATVERAQRTAWLGATRPTFGNDSIHLQLLKLPTTAFLNLNDMHLFSQKLNTLAIATVTSPP